MISSKSDLESARLDRHGIEPTPLLNLSGVLAKMECANAVGDMGSRVVRYILRRSEHEGLLRPGMEIVEAVSGSGAFALAYHGREMGYRVTIAMPEGGGPQAEILRSLGAELLLTSKDAAWPEACRLRDEFHSKQGVFLPDLAGNPLRVVCHRRTTGWELVHQSGAKIDAFVADLDSGDLLMGVSQTLIRWWPDVYVAAVRSEAGRSGDGASADAVIDLIEEVVEVGRMEAEETAEALYREHGLCVGPVSGANYAAALRLQERFPLVATVFPDAAFNAESGGALSCFRAGCESPARCQSKAMGLSIEEADGRGSQESARNGPVCGKKSLEGGRDPLPPPQFPTDGPESVS